MAAVGVAKILRAMAENAQGSNPGGIKGTGRGNEYLAAVSFLIPLLWFMGLGFLLGLYL